MKRLMVLLLCLLAMLTNPLSARQMNQEPPANPIVTPINGKLVFSSTAGLTVVNTQTGTHESVAGRGGDPDWDPTGTYIAAIRSEGASASLTNVLSSDVRTLVQDQTTRNNAIEYRTTAGWSADGQQIMYLVRTFVDLTIITGGSSFRLETVNVNTGTTNVVYEIPLHTQMNSLFPVPVDSENVVLDSIDDARWNPVYTDWVLIEPIGMGKRTSTGEDIGVYEAGLYNYVTGQYISLKPLLPQLIVSFTDWSADGRKIAMNTMTGISVIEFTLQDGQPNLRLITDSIDSRDQSVLQWLGAGDVLITGTTIPYRTTFIAQVIDDQWYSTEFVALASLQPQYAGGNRDFHLTADTAERNQLSCMFFDQVYASRLQVGQRGRVTFTDGTPSRLRSAPGTAGTVVTQMQEGTSFEIIGGSYCVDNYRWWQVRLDDGTVGWAAEGNPPDYWLEPAQ